MPQRRANIDENGHSPGALRGGAILALHSRQAARLVQGRRATNKHAAILGLFGFAAALRPIHEGVAEHDPYARYWHSKVVAEIDRADHILTVLKAALEEAMHAEAGFSSAEVASELPMLVELRFASREAYAAARTLASFDRLALAALSARHIGLVAETRLQELIDHGGTALRRLFFSPIGYRRTGVQAADIRADNRIARRARELMGLLPADLLAAVATDSEVASEANAPQPSTPRISTVLTAAQ